MKHTICHLLFAVCCFAPAFAAQEGTPAYYEKSTDTAVAGAYKARGYSDYVGQSGRKQIVSQSSQTYYVPRPQPVSSGAMTVNGVATPVSAESATTIWADYARRFANFEFKTGVNSVLKWDDMLFNEFGVGAQHVFSLRNVDLFLTGEYRMGFLGSAGMSMDYDLEPYDYSDPHYGIFTISMGQSSGDTSRMQFGIGAKRVWDIGGWKLSPSIGYEIFKHNLEMSDHIYPNPGVYLPLMTADGNYVFGDTAGNYYSIPVSTAETSEIPDDYYQVCMSPEDIKLVQSSGAGQIVGGLVMSDYNPIPGAETIPWGVGPGECVIIGGDGMIQIPGTTHIYNTTWSGIYVGLEVEKQMTLADKLRFYVQMGLPSYSSEGIWPNRTDWQQGPSFIDEGSSGSYSYRAEMEYTYKMSERLTLSLKADMDYFHVGQIGGKLYLASYSTWAMDENGQYLLDDNDLPILETIEAHTEEISDSLEHANWQSFGLHLGLKVSF